MNNVISLEARRRLKKYPYVKEHDLKTLEYHHSQLKRYKRLLFLWSRLEAKLKKVLEELK